MDCTPLCKEVVGGLAIKVGKHLSKYLSKPKFFLAYKSIICYSEIGFFHLINRCKIRIILKGGISQ